LGRFAAARCEAAPGTGCLHQRCPSDLSAETGVPPLTNAVEGTAEAGFPDEIAPLPEDYVFLKRRPSAFYGTGVVELLHMLRRDTIIIGGGATDRGVETSVREAVNLDLASVVVRQCCWSGDPAAHAYSLDKAMKMYARIRRLDQVAILREMRMIGGYRGRGTLNQRVAGQGIVHDDSKF